MQNIYELLCGCAGGENVRRQEPMSLHTTFRIGGPADLFVTPGSIQAVADSIRICKETQTPYAVIGNGSNLLVSDTGYRGVIIQIGRNLNQVSVNGEEIRAQAGAMLSVIAKTALSESLTGFEFASGIPGTLGGAAVMNAGAYGGEIKQVLKSVTVVECGRIAKKNVHAGDLGYRSSVYAFPNAVVAGAEFELAVDADGEARRRMEEFNMRRKEKQPLEYPSAGSTFKRPEGHFAGALIEQAGLKGTRIGGAEVSPKHAGFIVNYGGATCADVLNLIDLVRERVYKEFGVLLEPEIKIIK